MPRRFDRLVLWVGSTALAPACVIRIVQTKILLQVHRSHLSFLFLFFFFARVGRAWRANVQRQSRFTASVVYHYCSDKWSDEYLCLSRYWWTVSWLFVIFFVCTCFISSYSKSVCSLENKHDSLFYFTWFFFSQQYSFITQLTLLLKPVVASRWKMLKELLHKEFSRVCFPFESYYNQPCKLRWRWWSCGTPYFYSSYYLMTLLMIFMKDLLKLFKEFSVLSLNEGFKQNEFPKLHYILFQLQDLLKLLRLFRQPAKITSGCLY